METRQYHAMMERQGTCTPTHMGIHRELSEARATTPILIHMETHPVHTEVIR